MTSNATCACASCDAQRRYAYVTTCCPHGLSHGVACICGTQTRYTTWGELAAIVFPNCRAMTREERRAFEAGFWPNLDSAEPITFTDEATS